MRVFVADTEASIVGRALVVAVALSDDEGEPVDAAVPVCDADGDCVLADVLEGVPVSDSLDECDGDAVFDADADGDADSVGCAVAVTDGVVDVVATGVIAAVAVGV